MNEKDKNEMLEAILKENEAYQCKLSLANHLFIEFPLSANSFKGLSAY